MAQEIHIRPSDPETAREEIERTRARMSETIDEIEGVLVRKKAELQQKLDVTARIRANPLQAAGIVLGLGALLGFLTGGKKEVTRVIENSEKAEIWERRARRLLNIARSQEQEIDELESTLYDYVELVEEDDEDSALSSWSSFRTDVAERVTGFLSERPRQLVEEIRSRF